MANRSITASLGMGSKASFYKDVKFIELQVRTKAQYKAVKEALVYCGFDMKNRNVAELRFNKDNSNEIELVSEDSFGRNETQAIEIAYPDNASRSLVKMLRDLGYDHEKYYVVSFELFASGEAAGIMFVESKPKA